jgi:hypothetical protein
MKRCLNCGEEFSHSYCTHCGQKELLETITLKSIVHETLQVIFLLESPVLHTIQALCMRPGIFVRSYLDGKRKPYLAPVQFFLLCVTIYLLVFNLIGEQYFAFISRSAGVGSPDNLKRFGLDPQVMLASVRTNLSIFYFVQPPVFALFFRLFFAKSKTRYAENLVFSFYMIGAGLLFSTLIAVIALANIKFLIVRLIFLLFFYPYAIVQFSKSSGLLAYVKGFVSVVLSLLTYGMSVGGITLVYYLMK